CMVQVDPEVGMAFDEAMAELRAGGAIVSDVKLPTLAHGGAALGASIMAEASTALIALLGPRMGRIGIDTRIFLELGKSVTAQQYLSAQRPGTRLYEEMRAAFASVDLLATPATLLPAPRLDAFAVRIGDQDIAAIEAISRLTAPFNLTGLPAL